MRTCPLCMKTSGFSNVSGPDNRTYFLCDHCKLINTDTMHQPMASTKPTTAKQASSLQLSQKKLLNQAVQPASQFLNPGMKGMHYHSGEEPLVCDLLKNSEIECQNYDPEFFPDLEANEKFDFVFATEVLEKFYLPAREFQKINNLLAENGYLILMTDFWTTIPKFKTWAYPKNSTRVSFYHQKSMEYLGKKFKYKQVFTDGKRVVIFQKLPEEVAQTEE